MTIKIFIRLLLSFSLLFFLASGVSGNIVVLNGLTHETISSPGETYRKSIQIQNAGTEAQSVKVYIRDYWYSYKGESRHDEPGTMERSNAEWIEFAPKLLNLEPDERTMVEFEVNVPNNPSLNGTYWSVIMVEGLAPQDTSATAGLKIRTAIRYAVQVVTNIGNTGTRDLQFLGLELVNEDDENWLNVAIENTGERILKPDLSVEIFNSNGESMGIYKAEQRKAYPGTSILLSIPIEGIKPGTYAGVLVADCDEDHVFGTNINLEI